MPNQKRHKATKQHPMKSLLLFLGTLFTNLIFMLLPFMIGIKTSQYFGLKLYTGFYLLLLFLGILLSGQVSNKLFNQAKRVQLIRDWKDRVVAYASIIVFVMILFVPELLKTDTTFAYFLSFLSALTAAILIWRFFGSKELRNQFRFRRAKRVNPEVQRKAGRQLVVLLSAMFIFFLGFYPAIIAVIKVINLFNFGTPLEGIEIPISVVVIWSTFSGTLLVVTIITSIFWRIAMTFYLTVDELQELDKMPSPYVPLLKPTYTKVASKLLEWKIAWENKNVAE